MVKFIRLILIFFIIILISLGAYHLYDGWNKNKMTNVQTSLKPEENIKDDSGNELMDFSSLKEKNKDIIAWLKIQDTYIDYPIVQSENNQYYLNHTAENMESSVGSLFLDYRINPDFTDFNNIIYGHNLNNGKMFGQIVKYTNSEWFDSHNTGILYTPNKTYRVEFFAVLVTKSDSFVYNYAFTSQGEIEDHINNILSNAVYKRDINIDKNDKLLALSTCSYEFEEARTVLIGILK